MTPFARARRLLKPASLTLVPLALTTVSLSAQTQTPAPTPTPAAPKIYGGDPIRDTGPYDTRGVDYNKPFRPAEVTRKAMVIERVEPGYTADSRREGVEGVVRLRAILHHSGEVRDITVIKGLPGGLTERAIEAAKQIKFRPAQFHGRDVSQYVTLEYNFTLTLRDEDADKRAVILEQPEAEYTKEAREAGVEGKVVLEVSLDGEGTVGHVRVIELLPHGLTEKAVKAARKIKFTPAEHDGQKADVVRKFEYVFKLK